MRMNINNDLKTYTDYHQLLSDILKPLMLRITPDSKGIVLNQYYAATYSDEIMEFETFSRYMWGCSFLNIDAEKTDFLLNFIYERTCRTSKLYWGDIEDYSQMIVEMFPVVFFCLRNKERFDKLADAQKETIGSWFYQINNVKVYNNNWQCFIILINETLNALGLKYSEAAIKKAYKQIDGMYDKNGWYTDGANQLRDYYNAFAFHYYLLLWTTIRKRPESETIKARALQFSEEFIYWFDEDGSALPYGRSLTYKFAQSAFWSMMVAAGVCPEKNQIYKGIINRNIRWWHAQDIYDEDGILTLGYAYNNQQMTEVYNASGSSYWALKAFAMLLLANEDSFFAMNEEKLPELSDEKVMTGSHMIFERDSSNVMAFVMGQRPVNQFGQMECKYEKFVYSTKFPFCISRSYLSLELLAPDSNICVSLNGTDYIARHSVEDVKFAERYMSSLWKVSSGVSIRSIVVFGIPYHYRIHLIDSNEEIVLADCGFAFNQSEVVASEIGNKQAGVVGENCYSAVGSVIGEGVPVIIAAAPNTNIMYPRCVIPAIKYLLKPGRYVIVNKIGASYNASNYNAVDCSTSDHAASDYATSVYAASDYATSDYVASDYAGMTDFDVELRENSISFGKAGVEVDIEALSSYAVPRIEKTLLEEMKAKVRSIF